MSCAAKLSATSYQLGCTYCVQYSLSFWPRLIKIELIIVVGISDSPFDENDQDASVKNKDGGLPLHPDGRDLVPASLHMFAWYALDDMQKERATMGDPHETFNMHYNAEKNFFFMYRNFTSGKVKNIRKPEEN